MNAAHPYGYGGLGSYKVTDFINGGLCAFVLIMELGVMSLSWVNIVATGILSSKSLHKLTAVYKNAAVIIPIIYFPMILAQVWFLYDLSVHSSVCGCAFLCLPAVL